MKNIIFINRFYSPDLSATSRLLTQLAEELASGDCTVTIICSNRRYNDDTGRLPKQEVINGVAVNRINTFSMPRLGLLGRALEYVQFYISATGTLIIKTKRNDILVAKTDPPMMSILVRFAGSLKRAKTVNWLQDIFPEIAEELGFLPKRFGIGATLKFLRNWSLRYADANVVLGKNMQEKLTEFKVRKDKITIIPNWADERLVYPVPHDENSLRTEWQLQDKFVVAYSGNMGRAHEFESILGAAERLKNHHKIQFLIIGGGVKSEALKAECKNKGLDNVTFKDYQPDELLAQSLSAGDCHLVILSENLEGLIVPSKYYGIVAAGRRIINIGSETGEIAQLLQRYKNGHTTPPMNPEKLAFTIKEMANAAEERHTEINTLQDVGLNQAVRHWKELFEKVSLEERTGFLTKDLLKRGSR